MTSLRKPIILAAFSRPADARAALAELRDAEFSDKRIGVLVKDDDDRAEFKAFKDLEGNHAGAGAAAGAVAGAGGGALWALGIAAGVLPAIGPVIAGGLLGAVLASAAGGAAAGTAVGALIGLGVDDEEAAFYEEELRKGHPVVVVEGEERAAEAFRILNRHGAFFRPSPEASSPPPPSSGRTVLRPDEHIHA